MGFLDWLAAVARRLRAITGEQVTAWGRTVERRALRLFRVLAQVAATAATVSAVVVGWVCGPGWSVAERVIAITGPQVVAGLVAGAVFTVSLIRVAAAGLVERAVKAVR